VNAQDNKQQTTNLNLDKSQLQKPFPKPTFDIHQSPSLRFVSLPLFAPKQPRIHSRWYVPDSAAPFFLTRNLMAE